MGILFKYIKSRIFGNPLAISFDVTNRCNLKCPGCYWRNFPDKKELGLDDIKSLFKKFGKEGVQFCIYLGGEPMLRPDVLKLCSQYIPINWTVTNGTIRPVVIKKLLYGVSIDGGEEIHDKIRGKGVYGKAYGNFVDNKNSFTFTTISGLNKGEPEKIVKKWSNSKVRGAYFNFATPFRNKENKYWLNWGERGRVVDVLLKLKKEYGEFILLTTEQIEMLRFKNNSKKIKRCKEKHDKGLTASYYSDGMRKELCTLGESADCERCGSVCSTLPNSLFDINSEWKEIYSKLFKL